MAELVEPGLGVAAWADLASVRRTIEWVGLDQDRLEKSKFTGATVGRLLRRIVERHAPEGEIVAQLEAMTALMDEFDAADVARRAELVVAMRSALEGLVSIGELGARRHDLEPKARLSKPSRRDRRGRRSKDEGETSEAAASSDDAAEADAVTAAESSEEAASSDDEPTDGAEAQLDGVDGTSEPTEEESAGKDDTPEADADPTRGFLCRRRPLRLRGLGHLGGWSGIIPREPECRWGTSAYSTRTRCLCWLSLV